MDKAGSLNIVSYATNITKNLLQQITLGQTAHLTLPRFYPNGPPL